MKRFATDYPGVFITPAIIGEPVKSRHPGESRGPEQFEMTEFR